MDIDSVQKLLDPVRDSPLLPLWIVVAFVVGGAVFLPNWLLVFQTSVLVTPPLSFVIAIAGLMVSATTYFVVGRFFLGAFVARKASARVLRTIQGAGLEHIIALRLVPVLPFTLTNLVAGALGVPFRTFFAGTLIGLSPLVLAVTFLGDRALDVIKHPTPQSIAVLVAAIIGVLGLATLVKRIAGKRVKASEG